MPQVHRKLRQRLPLAPTLQQRHVPLALGQGTIRSPARAVCARQVPDRVTTRSAAVEAQGCSAQEFLVHRVRIRAACLRAHRRDKALPGHVPVSVQAVQVSDPERQASVQAVQVSDPEHPAAVAALVVPVVVATAVAAQVAPVVVATAVAAEAVPVVQAHQVALSVVVAVDVPAVGQHAGESRSVRSVKSSTTWRRRRSVV